MRYKNAGWLNGFTGKIGFTALWSEKLSGDEQWALEQRLIDSNGALQAWTQPTDWWWNRSTCCLQLNYAKLSCDATLRMRNMANAPLPSGAINGDLVLYNGATWTSAGYDGNGTDGSLSRSAGLLQNQQYFSIGAWVYLTSMSGYHMIFAESTGTDNLRTRFSLYIKDDGCICLSGRYNDADSGSLFTETATGLVTTGVWYHVAAVIDGATGNHKIYLNGIERQGTITVGAGTFENTKGAKMVIGANLEGLSNLFGYIENIRAYYEIITQEQWQAMVATGKDTI